MFSSDGDALIPGAAKKTQPLLLKNKKKKQKISNIEINNFENETMSFYQVH